MVGAGKNVWPNVDIEEGKNFFFFDYYYSGIDSNILFSGRSIYCALRLDHHQSSYYWSWS